MNGEVLLQYTGLCLICSKIIVFTLGAILCYSIISVGLRLWLLQFIFNYLEGVSEVLTKGAIEASTGGAAFY